MSRPRKYIGIEIICACGKKFETNKIRLDAGRGKFCSQACKYKYRVMPKRGKGTMVFTKENTGRFKKGMIPWHKGTKGLYKKDTTKIVKGVHYSPATEFKKGQQSWNKGIEWDDMAGDKHPNWQGNNVGYSGIHIWVYKTLGKADSCDKCDGLDAKRFEWHNISGEYKRDKSDWEKLCSKCHANHHKNWEKRKY